ncbi:MAG: CoA transferase [Dehalococcoidia bacterium]|nr:CoA transferase [Dehalococcoidia bacterium]
MVQALEGVRVLDFTVGQQGPFSTTMLADLGADVIKVEEPLAGDFGRYYNVYEGKNAYFLQHNRGKKAIAVDLKHPRGKEVILKLVSTADVVVQNFRHGAMTRLGLSYADLSAINPRLIYASASGFGPKGPWSARPALDLAVQGMAGVMSVTGNPGDPPTPAGIPIADQVGGMVLAYGVMVALFHRERTGAGQEIDVSLFGTQLALQSFNITASLFRGRNQPRRSRTMASPFWTTYRCGDGRWIAVAMLQFERSWPAMCAAIGRDDLIDDQRFSTAVNCIRNGAELIAILDEIFATRPSEDWLHTLGEFDLICAPVNSYMDLASFPQALENDYIVDYDHPTYGPIKMVGLPVSLSKTPGNPFHPAPGHGEHTDEVLKSLGYSPDEIQTMKDELIIRRE